MTSYSNTPKWMSSLMSLLAQVTERTQPADPKARSYTFRAQETYLVMSRQRRFLGGNVDWNPNHIVAIEPGHIPIYPDTHIHVWVTEDAPWDGVPLGPWAT